MQKYCFEYFFVSLMFLTTNQTEYSCAHRLDEVLVHIYKYKHKESLCTSYVRMQVHPKMVMDSDVRYNLFVTCGGHSIRYCE